MDENKGLFKYTEQERAKIAVKLLLSLSKPVLAGIIVSELHGHEDAVYTLQFDDQKIISGSRDRTIKIWENGDVSKTLLGHKASVLCLQYDKDIIVSGSSDCSVIVWDIYTGNILRHLFSHSEPVLNLQFKDNILVTCSRDKTIKIWDIQTGTVLKTLIGHTSAVNAVQFQEDLIVSASGDQTIKLWDFNGNLIKTLVQYTRGIVCMQLKGNLIVTGSSHLVDSFVGHSHLVRSIQFDKRKLVSSSYDHTVKIWDIKNGKLIHDLKGHTDSVLKVQFNDTKIVSAGHDKKIIVWDFTVGLDDPQDKLVLSNGKQVPLQDITNNVKQRQKDKLECKVPKQVKVKEIPYPDSPITKGTRISDKLVPTEQPVIDPFPDQPDVFTEMVDSEDELINAIAEFVKM
ncbi:hypothetical protein HK103_000245 [Boothiomyces macroporosus]|uniref:Uncharacterized protein n=1 Tax=Boothiomyces macroporosus TaxID=261099 RepID=A0AAD5UPX1_9FUNG|nr:hypothetical protein HK103_000245 [Boothiomyces macroporosus]